MNINLTENSFIFQSAKRTLERELDRCVKLLKDNEDAWNEYMDLKLHKISYGFNGDFELNGAMVTFDNDALNGYFYSFCDDEYDNFVEWCKEGGIEWDGLRDNIGSTSSFYLGTLHNNYADKYSVALAECSYDFNMSMLTFKEENGVIRPVFDIKEDDDIEEIVNGMLDLSENLYNDTKDKLDDICKVYEYIKAFKDNQEEIFAEYIKDSWINNI